MNFKSLTLTAAALSAALILPTFAQDASSTAPAPMGAETAAPAKAATPAKKTAAKKSHKKHAAKKSTVKAATTTSETTAK